MAVLSTNQFKQSSVVGQLDLVTNPNPSVLTALWNPSGTGTLIPGEGVILDDLGASDYTGVVPIVDKRALTTDAIEGVVIYDAKKATKDPGDYVQVIRKHGVVVMEASAAILRGAKVALVFASPGQVVTQTTEALFGKALDKAFAAGDLIRVEVLAEGVV